MYIHLIVWLEEDKKNALVCLFVYIEWISFRII